MPTVNVAGVEGQISEAEGKALSVSLGDVDDVDEVDVMHPDRVLEVAMVGLGRVANL